MHRPGDRNTAVCLSSQLSQDFSWSNAFVLSAVDYQLAQRSRPHWFVSWYGDGQSRGAVRTQQGMASVLTPLREIPTTGKMVGKCATMLDVEDQFS
jgi:hypothetical protein